MTPKELEDLIAALAATPVPDLTGPDLTGQMFGYRLDDGDPEPLFIIARVLKAPDGFDLPKGVGWCRCYSRVVPFGEEGTVLRAWLARRAPLLSDAEMAALFQGKHDDEEVTRKYPLVRMHCGPVTEAA